HLAHHEVVLVVPGDGRHDGCPVGARLREVLALAAIPREDDGANLVRDLARPRTVLLQQHQLMTGGEQFLGEVVADLAAAHHDDVHQACSFAVSCAACGWCPVGAMTRITPLSMGSPTKPAMDSTIMSVRQMMAMPIAAYASARTGSLTLATTMGTE